jgi:uncharacterized membrane protein
VITFDRVLILLLIVAVFLLAQQVAQWSGVFNTIKILMEQFQPGHNI